MKTHWHKRWLLAYEQKGTVVAACKAVGISRDTAYSHRRRFPEFAAEWDACEQAVTEVLEKTLVEIAIHGEGGPQVRALEFALKSRRPEKYRESVKVDHGGTINHEVRTGMEVEIERLAEELATRGASDAARADAPPLLEPAGESGPASA